MKQKRNLVKIIITCTIVALVSPLTVCAKPTGYKPNNKSQSFVRQRKEQLEGQLGRYAKLGTGRRFIEAMQARSIEFSDVVGKAMEVIEGGQRGPIGERFFQLMEDQPIYNIMYRHAVKEIQANANANAKNPWYGVLQYLVVRSNQPYLAPRVPRAPKVPRVPRVPRVLKPYQSQNSISVEELKSMNDKFAMNSFLKSELELPRRYQPYLVPRVLKPYQSQSSIFVDDKFIKAMDDLLKNELGVPRHYQSQRLISVGEVKFINDKSVEMMDTFLEKNFEEYVLKGKDPNKSNQIFQLLREIAVSLIGLKDKRPGDSERIADTFREALVIASGRLQMDITKFKEESGDSGCNLFYGTPRCVEK